MAEALTIARPYAEAAFKLAAETKKVKEGSGALSRLATVMKADAANELLDNPNIDRAQAAGGQRVGAERAHHHGVGEDHGDIGQLGGDQRARQAQDGFGFDEGWRGHG